MSDARHIEQMAENIRAAMRSLQGNVPGIDPVLIFKTQVSIALADNRIHVDEFQFEAERNLLNRQDHIHLHLVCRLFEGQEPVTVGLRQCTAWNDTAGADAHLSDLAVSAVESAVELCWLKVTTSPGATG